MSATLAVAADVAAGPRIHVRGSARIDAQAARDAGDLVLSGALADDGGQALAGENVALTLAREADPRQIVSFSEDGQTARSCAAGFHDANDPRPQNAGGPVVLLTDEAGRFCVRVTVPRDKYVATIAWGGTTLLEGAKLDLPVDTGRQSITLRFDPEPRVVSLDKAQLTVQILASYQENQTTHAGASLPLFLTNERGDPLGAGATNSAGVLKLNVASERLGPAGRGELRVTFNGNVDLTKSVHSAPIERQARVVLQAPDDLRIPVAPEEGISLPIAASTKGGLAPTGSVEARIGDAVVGAAPLENGKAALVVTFGGPREETDAEVRIRYLPSAPWLIPGEDAIVRVRVKGPSPWRQAPLVVAGLAVVLWLVLGRIKPKPLTPKSTMPPKAAILGEARVEVLRPTRDSRAGWSGRVIDAHDAVPIRGARVRIERPGFERAQVTASSFVNEAGRFELRAEGGGEGFDELVVDGPLHAELRQPLPPCGELQIALVLRKRRLLERLVAWAKRRGRPYDTHPEPTPGHVRRAAGNDFAMAKWADAVEKAAYAGGDVDARVEAEVDRLAPVGVPPHGDPGLTVRDVPPEEEPPSSPRPSEAPGSGATVRGLGATGFDPRSTLPLEKAPPKVPRPS